MRFMSTIVTLAMVRGSLAVASYDEYRDADIEQSGYLPNHNMDPNIVDSSAFGQIWKLAFNTNEQFYAKTLTYTPLTGGPQLLFTASSQNWIRTLNAKTGALINSRQVHTPFLQSDIGCGDIPNYIGITGTPVIDPATDIAYFFSKTYIPNYRIPGNIGVQNGVYYFHAVNVNTLADVYAPVLIDGSVADNDPRKYFVGGIILQRPSLTQIGSVVYGAFGGHCDLFNFTGVVIGIDINKAKITSQFVMASGPLVSQTNNLLDIKGGGEAGIWMSGMSISSDGGRLFVVSGNGDAHENLGVPASGSSGVRTLGEAAINLQVDASTGKLGVADYFQPFDYQGMDGNDQDFGAGGIVLLDPGTFSGGGVDRMAVTAGKNGKIYVLNANNLGGYRLGSGQTDGILQTIATGKSVFGAAGSYPLEGGFMYVTPVGYPTYVYSIGFTQAGIPQFSKIAQTNEISAGRVGVGVPTVTSLNGQPGTAILWMTDPDAGIRAWYAVPDSGTLQNIPMPQIGGANKFQRPAFGDGRVYITDSNGVLYCLGSPVNLPLNCTSPVDFGQVALGTKATRLVNCTANTAISSLNGLDIDNDYFQASNTSLPKGALAVGSKFSIPVTWDLTNVQSSSNANASYGDVTPGFKSTPLTLFTTNAAAGFATVFPISLTGTEVSTKPFLAVTPGTLDFGGITVLDPKNIPSQSGVMTIANKGLGPLTILGYAYTNDIANKNPVYANSTAKNGVWNLGSGFTAATLPAIGSKIAANTALSIDASFNPVTGIGSYDSYFQVWSDGGVVTITLEGSASTAPIANFSISTSEGGWLPSTNLLMDFGNVASGSSSSREIRLCNSGGSSLQISKSKPPTGVFHLGDPNQLHESQLIPPGDCAFGEVLFVANTEEYNQPDIRLNNTWTLNVNDAGWGIHEVQITGTVVTNKVGPLNPNGKTVYEYLGCFLESTNGPRLFPNEPLAPSATTNDNGNCQTACYGAAQYAFAGTEFTQECWCGNTPPPLASQDLTDTFCNFACPGDSTDTCGGTGYISVFYDPTKYVEGTDPGLYGPQTPQQIGNYNYLGCYSEATNGRALSAAAPAEPAVGFTLESCMVACQGYIMWGMEYSEQCYCGNTLGVGAVNQTSSNPSVNGCNMVCKGNVLEYCGGGSRLNLYILDSNDPVPTGTVTSNTVGSSTGLSVSTRSISASSTSSSPTSPPVPTGPQTVTVLPGWSYIGCYSEATTGRALNSLLLPIAGADTKVESCAVACAGYTYFGVEYGQECYCGNVIRSGSVVQASSDPNISGCNVLCAANALEYCGGGSRLNIYQVGSPVTSSTSSILPISTSSFRSSSSVVSTTSPSSSRVSSSSSRVVSTSSTGSISSSTSKLPSTSISRPATSSSKPASLSLSSSTVSTSQLASSSSKSVSLTLTSSTASTSRVISISSSVKSTLVSSSKLATTTSIQSSSSRLQSTSQSVTSSPTSRISSSKTSSIPSQLSTSSSKSASLTKASTATSTFIPSTVRSSSTAFSTLKASSSLSISSATTATSSPRGSTAVGSSTKSATSTGPPPLWTGTPTPGQMRGSSRYIGCANEVDGRALAGASFSSDTMTIELCQTFCSTNDYALSGVEYSTQCYCSNSVASPATLTNTGCTMPCGGNSLELCGGPNLLNVFNNTAYIYPGHPQSVNGYAYQGCFQELTAGRLFPSFAYTDPVAMTVESCTSFCQTNIPGAGYAGIEYGQECYCAATLPTAAVSVASSSCNMLCMGSKKEFCGAGSLLDVYKYQPVLLKGRARKGYGGYGMYPVGG